MPCRQPCLYWYREWFNHSLLEKKGKPIWYFSLDQTSLQPCFIPQCHLSSSVVLGVLMKTSARWCASQPPWPSLKWSSWCPATTHSPLPMEVLKYPTGNAAGLLSYNAPSEQLVSGGGGRSHHVGRENRHRDRRGEAYCGLDRKRELWSRRGGSVCNNASGRSTPQEHQSLNTFHFETHMNTINDNRRGFDTLVRCTLNWHVDKHVGNSMFKWRETKARIHEDREKRKQRKSSLWCHMSQLPHLPTLSLNLTSRSQTPPSLALVFSSISKSHIWLFDLFQQFHGCTSLPHCSALLLLPHLKQSSPPYLLLLKSGDLHTHESLFLPLNDFV